MSTPIVNDFKGTGFAVTTGWGTPTAITAITNANPAVVTSAAHGLADGDVVKLAGVGGMTEVNGGIFAVNVLTADTYELVHLDTMDYGVYTSGGAFCPETSVRLSNRQPLICRSVPAVTAIPT